MKAFWYSNNESIRGTLNDSGNHTYINDTCWQKKKKKWRIEKARAGRNFRTPFSKQKKTHDKS